MPVALTRAVPRSLAACELTHLDRSPIDVDRASTQHALYEDELRRLGCRVERVEAAHELPDSVFVEDTALTFDELAVVTRPGARSRQPEVGPVADALVRYRQVQRLIEPATLDGGDVLRLGRSIYVGISTRTNVEGARQLADAVSGFGYTIRCVRVRGCLHLKSAVTALDERTVICNPDWVDARCFEGHDAVHVDPAEPFAANVLRLGDSVICAAAYERTARALRLRGHDVRTVDVSELAKAEAGVTCCSLILS